MERKFIEDNKISLVCTTQEASDIWYAVEQMISDMETAGQQEVSIYVRLKALADTFKGK